MVLGPESEGKGTFLSNVEEERRVYGEDIGGGLQLEKKSLRENVGSFGAIARS